MKLNVNLPHHPYDIIIENGALSQVGSWLSQLWQPQKLVIITDNRVARLYAEKVKLSLEAAGFKVFTFDFLEGEASKNLTTVNKAVATVSWPWVAELLVIWQALLLRPTCEAFISFRFRPV